MAAHHHIFIRIAGAFYDSEDVVELHRSGEEVVAYVEFQGEVLAVDGFLLYYGELVLVQEYVARPGQVVHRQVEAHGPVVEDLHRQP